MLLYLANRLNVKLKSGCLPAVDNVSSFYITVLPSMCNVILSHTCKLAHNKISANLRGAVPVSLAIFTVFLTR